MFPLFGQNSRKELSSKQLPPRLKLAIFAIGSRFVQQAFQAQIPSPAEFAKRADEAQQGKPVGLDEIKATFLLSVHHMSDSLDSLALADLGRLVRMAQVWSYRFTRSGATGRTEEFDLDEFSGIWWSIVTLETCCNALV